MVVSAFGLREGLLYGQLDPRQRAEDPLVVAAREEGRRLGRFVEHGDLLDRWIAPLFADESPGLARLRHVARSEEHTSELQSLMRISYAVFCLKKKKKKRINNNTKLRIKKKLKRQTDSKDHKKKRRRDRHIKTLNHECRKEQHIYNRRQHI